MKGLRSVVSCFCLVIVIAFAISSGIFSVSNVTTVEAAGKVRINKKKVTIYTGKTVKLKIKGTTKRAKWISSNKKVATVNKKGQVKGKKAGKATITAKVGKKKYKCKVIVKKKKNSINMTGTVTNKIEYITNRCAFKYTGSVYRIFFGLLYEDQITRASARGVADIKIVTDKGEEVYNKSVSFTEDNFGYWTLDSNIGKKYVCCIEIPEKDIKSGTVKTGLLSLAVTLSTGQHFSEYNCSINNLPLVSASDLCKVIPPEPTIVADYYVSGKLKTMCDIISTECNVKRNGIGGFTLELNIDGTKIYDADGSMGNASCMFLVKLYKNGVVVDDKIASVYSLYSGESFTKTVTFLGLEEGVYELVITDY